LKLGIRRGVDRFGPKPEPLELVELPHFPRHQVNNGETKINQHPARLFRPPPRVQRLNTALIEELVEKRDQPAEMALRIHRCHHEVVGKRTVIAHIDRDGVGRTVVIEERSNALHVPKQCAI
jgi:hypothetical protein